MNDVALIVHSCDRYAFLYKGFDIFFSKNWDFEIPCNCYFATEEKEAVLHGFTNIQSGTGAWADRLSLLLRNSVKEKYILYFQEDMWLNKPVRRAFFDNLFNLATEHAWKQVKLHSSGVYKTSPTELFIEGFNVANVDKKASGFLMSHQITLWDKEFLKAQLRKNEHPWRNERKGTKRLRKLDHAIFQIDYFAENGSGPINQNRNINGRSEYQAVSNNGMLKDNVIPYIAELLNDGGVNRDYGLELKRHYDNKLTHDGMQKPKKVDFFKRLKNMVQGKKTYS